MSASAVLSVRVTQAEKSLLQAAAAQACSAISEFMRRKAGSRRARNYVPPRSDIGE